MVQFLTINIGGRHGVRRERRLPIWLSVGGMTTTSQPNVESSQAAWWWMPIMELAETAKKIGQDDPRRITHCLKVGLAITLVSLLYYVQPLYKIFRDSGVWAVLTVVLVSEFTVGGTLGKGLNRMFATLLGGALGVGVQRLAALFGDIGHPIVLGLLVMVVNAVVTFVRFFPKMKARYDYGMIVLMLTFSMVSVSGYRDEEALMIAYKRALTIIFGCVIAVIVCIFVSPVWVGKDLQALIAANLDKLACFLEAFSGAPETKIDQSVLQGYTSVRTSKNSEETMANLARWEPGHGRFLFRHPWKQYLKVGTLARDCSYKFEVLNGYLESDIQIQEGGDEEIRGKIEEWCREMSRESGKALKKLSEAIRTMTHPTSMALLHIDNSKAAAKNLLALFENINIFESSNIDTNLLEMIPAAAVASAVMDIVVCTERISDAVKELASLSHFKTIDPVLTQEQP